MPPKGIPYAWEKIRELEVTVIALAEATDIPVQAWINYWNAEDGVAAINGLASELTPRQFDRAHDLLAHFVVWDPNVPNIAEQQICAHIETLLNVNLFKLKAIAALAGIDEERVERFTKKEYDALDSAETLRLGILASRLFYAFNGEHSLQRKGVT